MTPPTSAPAPAPPSGKRRRWILLALFAALLAGGAGLWQQLAPWRAWREAQAALKKHDLAAAAASLDEYLQRRPADAEAWFLAGRTARRLGRYADAERCLVRCQELTGVTDATRLEWDLFRVQRGDLGEVHTRLRMTVPPDHPDAPLVLEALARGYLNADRLVDVMEACDLWISRQPDHPWPWLWRGGIFERLGNFHQARTDYRRALELAPEDTDIRLALAALYVRARQPGQATEHFEHVLQRFPDNEEALLGLASCRIDEGQPAASVPLLDKVLARDAPPARALFLRGKAALAQDDAADARRWLERATAQAPHDPEAWHQLTLALRIEGRDADADKLAPRVEALRKDTGRLDELIRIIGRNPEDAAPRHEAGVLALRIGRTEEGVRYLEGALRLPGEHRETHAVLADYFQQAGDPRAEHHRRLAQQPPMP